MEPIVLERCAFSGQAECDLLPREKPSSWPPWGCLAFCDQIGTSHSASKKFGSHRLGRIFLSVGTGGCHTALKIATFRDDGEVEEVFTSTTVRTRDTVFPLFGGAGTKPATEAELQEFGESVRVRVRPGEVEGPSLALRHPDVEIEEAEGNLGKMAEVENNPSLKSCEDEPRRPVPTQPEEPRRRITVKRPARPVEWREEQQSGGGDDPSRKNRQRDLSESLAQLCSCVPL